MQFESIIEVRIIENLNMDEFPVDLFYVELRVEWGQEPRRLQAVFKTLRSAVPQRDSRT